MKNMIQKLTNNKEFFDRIREDNDRLESRVKIAIINLKQKRQDYESSKRKEEEKENK